MPIVKETIRKQAIPNQLTNTRYLDYKLTLNRGKFDWNSVSQKLNKSQDECFYQYTRFLASTKEQFKKEVLSKQNLTNYKLIEELIEDHNNFKQK